MHDLNPMLLLQSGKTFHLRWGAAFLSGFMACITQAEIHPAHRRRRAVPENRLLQQQHPDGFGFAGCA
ncbi:MAG TPA: hypothetical protein P5031_07020, partial [Candidatus Syntrophosphaera sp.]|nr:hypothetical protein [Candidatus Syntrophosphaera sp.]